MQKIVSRSHFQEKNSLNTWSKSFLLATIALAPSVHNTLNHLHVIVYLVVINNFKISSSLVRVHKDWPNTMASWAPLFSSCLTNTKRSPELLISGNSSQSLQEMLWTFCTQDNKCCSTFGPCLSLFDKLLYLTELPHQISPPFLCPREHQLYCLTAKE